MAAGKLQPYVTLIRGVLDQIRAAPPGDWRGAIRAQLENKEARWLETLRRAVFDRPESLYARLFRLADCEFTDLKESLGRRGLEGTLELLRDAGVYLTSEEFKGSEPVVRGGRRFDLRDGEFRNPLVEGRIVGSSSGSRGRSVKSPASLEYEAYIESLRRIEAVELGFDKFSEAMVRPLPPSMIGLRVGIANAKAGRPPKRWFAPEARLRGTWHYRALSCALVAAARLHGVRAPFPTLLPANDFSPVARWIAAEKKRGRCCSIGGFVSPLVRVAAAALENGNDIAGTLFIAGGEALTPAKRKLIESAGARVCQRYWISEVGPVGFPCRHSLERNTLHFLEDSVAAVMRSRKAPLSELTIEAALFTTLHPAAPNILINAEMGDSAVVERAPCDCTYAELGFTTKVREVMSFSKLTGQGVTLVGTDLIELLEDVLPRKFGGAAGDYQLVERDQAGQTTLALRVSPRVGRPPRDEVRAFFLRALRKYYGGSLASRLWEHSEALEVEFAEPVAGAGGKVLPIELLRSGEGRA